MSAVNMDQKLFAELLEGDRPVLVDFWAPWVRLLPQDQRPIRQDRGEYQDRLVVGKVNVDAETQLAQAGADRGASHPGAVPGREGGWLHRRPRVQGHDRDVYSGSPCEVKEAEHDDTRPCL